MNQRITSICVLLGTAVSVATAENDIKDNEFNPVNTGVTTLSIAPDARTFALSFAGYNRKKGEDDLVYVAINTYWEDVRITLPVLKTNGSWYLSVNTWGDGQGRYFYPEGTETRIASEFIMRPRSVAVFTGRKF